jgi:hypothetical protein
MIAKVFFSFVNKALPYALTSFKAWKNWWSTYKERITFKWNAEHKSGIRDDASIVGATIAAKHYAFTPNYVNTKEQWW